MTTNPRRRLRLRELLPKPYVAHLPEAGSYTPPPPNPDDGPRQRRIHGPGRPLEMLTMGEAALVYANTHADAVDAWRHNFPASAEVHDGVHVTEAGVMPLDEPFSLDGEGADDGR
ncbi:hypothetical protein [Dietzia sp. ANT_WB102]|uniref:hypothetical protein n=1 Tax=Dietzia sp. ANT_WB102 TaxID=2597345 RepID=UPI0011EF69B4|nr:hypothetical protein [Dietzia sp. ANT_WB102]KAA0917002.1 hypothetical protein FQ137_12220 [Dietzia sp. ANT_WB102]